MDEEGEIYGITTVFDGLPEAALGFAVWSFEPMPSGFKDALQDRHNLAVLTLADSYLSWLRLNQSTI
jgi:hypothetical protein